MLTAQEIKEKAFEKAVFGGYDMGSVDDFLEEAANDFTALQKENQTLRAKMKVLVDKIEEYRSTEDAMRLALVSAQKIGVQIESDARQKSDALLTDARQNADSMVSKAQSYADNLTKNAKATLASEEAKANAAKRSTAEFVDNMKKLCQKQLEFLNALDNYTGAEPAAAAETPAAADAPEQDLDTTVKSIEDSISKLVDEPAQPELPEGYVNDAQRYSYTDDAAADPQATRRSTFTD